MIRRSSPAEAETHFAIQRAASLAGLAHIYPPEQYPYPDEEIRRRWCETEGTVLVCERDGEVVGVALSSGAGCTASTCCRSTGVPA